jgi:hypothetical protein
MPPATSQSTELRSHDCQASQRQTNLVYVEFVMTNKTNQGLD